VVTRYNLSNNPTGTYTNVYTQTAQFGGVIYGVMGDLEVDTVTGRWYVTDYNGMNGINDDNHIWSGNMNGTLPQPTQFSTDLASINGFAVVGFTLNRVLTLTVWDAVNPTYTETAGNPSPNGTGITIITTANANDSETANQTVRHGVIY
jgi:hypothetical protein